MGLLSKNQTSTDTASLAPSEATLVNPNEKQTENVEIKLSQLLSESEREKYQARTSQKAPTIVGKLFKSSSSSNSKAQVGTAEPVDPVKKVKMTRSEYLAYWARDEQGNYVGTEPEDAGRAVWRRKLWAELYLPPPEKNLDVSGFTGGKAMPADFTGARESGYSWLGEK